MIIIESSKDLSPELLKNLRELLFDMDQKSICGVGFAVQTTCLCPNMSLTNEVIKKYNHLFEKLISKYVEELFSKFGKKIYIVNYECGLNNNVRILIDIEEIGDTISLLEFINKDVTIDIFDLSTIELTKIFIEIDNINEKLKKLKNENELQDIKNKFGEKDLDHVLPTFFPDVFK